MLRPFLKTSFYLFQLTICLLFFLEKTQRDRFPVFYTSTRPHSVRLLYKHPRSRMSHPPRRIFSWRRLLFLLS